MDSEVIAFSSPSVNILQVYFYRHLHFRVSDKNLCERILYSAVHLLERSMELAGLHRHHHGVRNDIIHTDNQSLPCVSSGYTVQMRKLFNADSTVMSTWSWSVSQSFCAVICVTHYAGCRWEIRQVTSSCIDATLFETSQPDRTLLCLKTARQNPFYWV